MFLIASVFLLWSGITHGDGNKMTSNAMLFDRVLNAALNHDRAELKVLSDQGAINSLDGQGLSALLRTIVLNRLDATAALIEHGGDVDAYGGDLAKDVIDQTAFLYAGATGNVAALKLLIAAGARTDIYNYYGGTALIPAAEKGHEAAVRLLLEKSAVDVNHVNKLGWTALMEAVVLSDGGPVHQRIVELLLKHGADPEITDRDGVTALQHAKSKDYEEITRLLSSHRR